MGFFLLRTQNINIKQDLMGFDKYYFTIEQHGCVYNNYCTKYQNMNYCSLTKSNKNLNVIIDHPRNQLF